MVVAHPYFDLATPIVIGHRGYAAEVPENTLASFQAGLEAGAEILESDVHLTRDGIPVLIHDAEVDRVSDGSGRVAAHTLAELKRLDAGYRFCRAGERSHPYRGRDLRIPALHEAFEAFPDVRFNLELKEDVPGIVERTVELVAASGREARTLLTAGDDTLMEKLHRRLDAEAVETARGASAGDVVAFVRAAAEGVAPPPGPMALQVPAEFGGRALVTPEFVSHAHAHGLHVHVWTIDEAEDMNRLLDLGVDGLVTNQPARLARLIGGRGGQP
jgi:glycerophosphoryl diester phosphodiesterase